MPPLTRRALLFAAAAVAGGGLQGSAGRVGRPAARESPGAGPSPGERDTGRIRHRDARTRLGEPARRCRSGGDRSPRHRPGPGLAPVARSAGSRWRLRPSVARLPAGAFRAQLDALASAGHTAIGPDTYLDHLLTGAALPAKPVLLSFDDAQGTQASEALPQLARRDMTATFFAMTVVGLGDKAGCVGRRPAPDGRRRHDDRRSHLDDHRVDRYSTKDWAVQLEQPRAVLEKTVGKPVTHFAYPYGA